MRSKAQTVEKPKVIKGQANTQEPEGKELVLSPERRFKGAVKTVQHKRAVIKALESSLGIVTTALKQMDGAVSRTQFYTWVREDEAFAEAVTEIKDIQLDFGESQLLKKMKDNDTAAIIFFLKTQGKGRGYIERSETALIGAIKTSIVIE